ncbi:hypothetical protein NDU88_005788 [Pleurodeles waltl]|uniref:SURP and G-patch domain-containing protein 2 n=3 Tax=Pleurodeles waltl TaxID=8319 RepID=A0AAV7L5I3_PLEWA|nr:hypothetical protein NDU88_005788 [Pleurodeles waltl]
MSRAGVSILPVGGECQCVKGFHLAVARRREKKVGGQFGVTVQRVHPEMAAKRMTREIFDAVVQEKVRKYRITRDEAIEETLHELKVQAGVPRPSSRTERYEDYPEPERYGREGPVRSEHDDPMRDAPLRSPRDSGSWREDSRRDSFTVPPVREYESGPFDSFTERRRSRSPPTIAKDYLPERGFRSKFDREDLPRSRDALYAREPEFREPEFREPRVPPPRREYSPRRSPPRAFVPPPVYDEFRPRGPREEFVDRGPERFDHPGPIAHEFRSPRGRDAVPMRGRGATRGRGLMRGEGIVPRGRGSKIGPPGRGGAVGVARGRGAAAAKITRPPVKEPIIDLNDNHNIFHKNGNQLIRWAGFDSIRVGNEYLNEQELLFQRDTETCSKAVTAFKIFLTQAFRDYCFFLAKDLKHPVLKSPRIDNELLNLLVDKNAVKTKNCFFEIIRPYDGGMRKMQTGILKSIIPLLMACNNYELRQKSGYEGSGGISIAFEKNISLCRQSLVLLGQTFALGTSIRQEKILESIGLQGMAPNPNDYPNLKDSFLFGKEYMTHLKAWLTKSGYPIHMAPMPVKEEKVPDVKIKKESKDKTNADAKIVEAINKLAEHCINIFKGKTTEKQPEFWFLFDENSPEYQYYRMKLAETQKVRQTMKDGRQQTTKATAEEIAAESVKSIELSRKVREMKTRLFKNVALAKRRRLRGAYEPLRAPKVSESAAPAEKSHQSLEVDAKTKDTAEKLAKFVAQMGPEVEQFSKENSESNPEFWFLKEKESPAYKYYQAKVAELRKTEAKEKAAEPKEEPQPEVEAESPDGEIAEAAVESEISPESASQDEVAKKAPVRTLPRKRVTALKVGMLPAKRVCHVEDPKVHDPVRIAYERPKGRPAQKKKPEKRDLEYANKKLTDKNVGFQMLSKMGWKEGEGLGSEGAGIKDPVKVGTTSRGEGLGGANSKKEDTFDSFRQRMMQMYKHKQTN